MKSLNIIMSAALCSALLVADEAKSDFGVSANVALTSNYVWRGMTQTKDRAALQGGVDLTYKNGYFGVWASNASYIDSPISYEIDYYGGYADEAYGIGYDLGFQTCSYSNDHKNSDYGQFTLGLSKKIDIVKVGVKGYRAFKTNTYLPSNAVESTVAVSLPEEFTVDFLLGHYYDNGTYYQAGVSKSLNEMFSVSVAYAGINGEDGIKDENTLLATVKALF